MTNNAVLPSFGVRNRKMTNQRFRKPSIKNIDGRLFRLEEQLEELQHANRRLRITILALVLVGGALVTMAQASPSSGEIVEAGQLALRNATRSSLDIPGANTPGLTFYHEGSKSAWARAEPSKL